MTYLTSFCSELLKLSKVTIFYPLVLAAFCIPFITVYDYSSPKEKINFNGWDNFYIEGFRVFIFLLLPLFIILINALLMQIEYRNNTWKQVLSSPQSHLQILLAKFLVLQLLVVVFIVLFNIFMAIGCVIVNKFMDNGLSIYWMNGKRLLILNLMAYISTLGISSLCFWLSLRFQNFITPIALGLLLWLIGPIAALELNIPYFDKYPFVLPFTILVEKYEGVRMMYQYISIAYCILLFLCAYTEFYLRTMKMGSFWNKK